MRPIITSRDYFRRRRQAATERRLAENGKTCPICGRVYLDDAKMRIACSLTCTEVAMQRRRATA